MGVGEGVGAVIKLALAQQFDLELGTVMLVKVLQLACIPAVYLILQEKTEAVPLLLL
jgi:hypothetical protein